MGENGGPAPASEQNITNIPTVRITTAQASKFFNLIFANDKNSSSSYLKVKVFNVLFVWKNLKKTNPLNAFLVHIIFTKNAYHDGYEW